MATRLYLPASGTAPLTVLGTSTEWTVVSDVVRLPMSPVRTGTALATRTMAWAAGTTEYWVWWQFQSPPIQSPVLLRGNSSIVIGKCAETTTGGDTNIIYVLRLVSAAGTDKGTLASVITGTTEFPLMAAAATAIRQRAVDPLQADVGDILVLEVGVLGITPATENIQMRIGDPAATADFAFTAGLTTDLVPWFELGDDVHFGEAYFDLHYVNSVAAGTTLVLRPVQSATEVSLTVAAGQIIPIKSKKHEVSSAVSVGLLP